MKRNLLILCCTTILCLSLSSCSLKNAITGNTTDDSLTASENTNNADNVNNTEGNITNDTTTDEGSNSKDASSTVANNNFTESNDSSSSANTSSSSTSPKLTTTSDNSTVSRSCRIFYYNKVDSKTYCVDTSSTVTDNAFVTALTEKLYTAPNNNNNFLTLSKDYGVKSATLDYDTNVLKVVFNNNFLDEMKVDDTTSQGFMASIIDTYAYNYNVNKVAVYFGNDLYTGIDGTSTAGYTTVDYTKVLKLD